VRSFNTRLLPGANKFRDLGVASSKEIEALEPVESLPEPLMASPSEPDVAAESPDTPAARAASASTSET
jgi:hypothetical protein